MDKKFLKMIALSAIICLVGINNANAGFSDDPKEKKSSWNCESGKLTLEECKTAKADCKVVKPLGGQPRCFVKCSNYTKAAKANRAKNKSSTEDFCTTLNSACMEGKWLGMFKCRNKNVPKGFIPANMEDDIF